MTRSQADTFGKAVLEILLKACLNYRGDGNQSDASTPDGDVEAPVEFRMLSDGGRRVLTFECNCQGDCHHKNRGRRVPGGAPATIDATDEYQGERGEGRRVRTIMRTGIDHVKSILRKILCLRSGKYQQDVEQNTSNAGR